MPQAIVAVKNHTMHSLVVLCIDCGSTKTTSVAHNSWRSQAPQKLCRPAEILKDQNSTEASPLYYKASRIIDALVKTERTNGASSPGCMVVGTIV